MVAEKQRKTLGGYFFATPGRDNDTGYGYVLDWG